MEAGWEGSLTHFVDHVEGAFEESVKNFRDLRRDGRLQLVDDRGHGREHFRFAGDGDGAPLVVEQDRVEQRRNEVVENHVGVVGPLDPAGDQLQRLLLDDAHALDQRLPGHHLAVQRRRGRDVLRHDLKITKQHYFKRTT